MRSVVGGAALSALLVLGVIPVRGEAPSLPRHDVPCEEQCRQELARDDAACDEARHDDAERGFCHQSVSARLDVCLRLCDD
jgi:hypothetical protein